MIRGVVLLGCLLMGLFGGSVFAADKLLSDQAEISFVDTSGNSEISTLSVKNLMTYQFSDKLLGSWRLFLLRGESDGEKNAERYATELRVDYLLTKRLYSFAGARWLKDTFAGVDPRYGLGAGVGYKFLLGPKHFLLGEAGLTYTVEDRTDGTDSDYLGGRLFGQYDYAFSDKSRFIQSLEFLQDFKESKNWLMNSETALTAALNSFMSLKASYLVQYDNEPVDDLDDTDTTLGMALVINY